ncbi:MAG: coproporphyrinogen dehydrogenase HemZ [Clostridia bacterium]|nr:coproporphyrinogen dehydrogenase HemZ [Clostridia bacterium]
MILTVKGNINKYYVQTLCMLFFPGAKFSESEEAGPETPIVDLLLEEREDGVFTSVSIKRGDKVCSAENFTEYKDGFTKGRIAKISSGKAIFDAGEKFFGITPSWGILTGVRPAKVASEYLLAGLGVQKTKRLLRSEYFLNPKKATLVTDVASNEIKIIKKLPRKRCSVYISIPFCPSRCAYCSFVSYTSEKLLSLIPDYLIALKQEIVEMFATIKRACLEVATVYIGGGTPTILSEKELDFLLTAIEENVDVTSLMEYTLEGGRPDTITAEKLAVAKLHGITRFSVNPQTLNDDVLKNIGRHHTVDDFYRAYDIAVNSGISHINTDLIAGLPGEDFISFSRTVDKIIELRPDNITFHTFCVKKASDILRSETDVFSLTGGDAGMSVDYSQVKAKNAKYKPYYMYRNKNTVGNFENVGFALEGAEGLYNIFMMEEIHPVFGAGAGAVTKLTRNDGLVVTNSKIVRIFNPKYPYEYLSADREIALAEKNLEIEKFFSAEE